jgi:hypothetical protein
MNNTVMSIPTNDQCITHEMISAWQKALHIRMKMIKDLKYHIAKTEDLITRSAKGENIEGLINLDLEIFIKKSTKKYQQLIGLNINAANVKKEMEEFHNILNSMLCKLND